MSQITDYLIKNGSSPKGVFYISLDHPMIKLLSLQKILDLYNDSIYPKGEETFLLFGIRNINELEKLFIYLCLHSGAIVAIKTCADALGTSPTTVANHLTLLEQANLIYRLPPAESGGKKILRARNKYYLVDAQTTLSLSRSSTGSIRN